MLTLTRAQLQVFCSQSVRDFEQSMVEHIRAEFPSESAVLGEADTLRLIRLGIELAGQYGFVAGEDVARYTDLMLFYGPDFELNSDMPWAAEILLHEAYDSPTLKMDELAVAAAIAAAEDGDEYSDNDSDSEVDDGVALSILCGQVIPLLRERLAPETFSMNDRDLRRRIVESSMRAAPYGISGTVALTQWVLLTFLIGEHFHQVPEINEYLLDSDVMPDQKLEALLAEIQTLLEQA